MLIEGAYFTEQLYSMFADWKWFNNNFYAGASHVIIEPERQDIVKDTFLRLIRDQKTCELEKADRLTNKVRQYDEFVFLQQMMRYFPQTCRNNPGLVEQYVTDSMLKDDKYEIAERLKLLTKINLESCNGIDPASVLDQMQVDLFFAEDYLKFVETAIDFEVIDKFENDDFKNRLQENVLQEIDEACSETDIDSLEDNVTKISLKFPDWNLNFEEELDYQRERLSEPDIENDDWERETYEYAPMDEDVMIQEMFTSLRIDSSI